MHLVWQNKSQPTKAVSNDIIHTGEVGPAMLCTQWATKAMYNLPSPSSPQPLKLTQAYKQGQSINGAADLCPNAGLLSPPQAGKPGKVTIHCL